MQNVSDAWKKQQKKTLVPESFLEISIKIGDPNAQSDVKPSDNGHKFFSNVEQTIEEVEKHPIKYATMEPWLWILDGTYRILGAEDIMPEPPAPEYEDFIPYGETETMLANYERFVSLAYFGSDLDKQKQLKWEEE